MKCQNLKKKVELKAVKGVQLMQRNVGKRVLIFCHFFTAPSTKVAKNDEDAEVGLIGNDVDTKRSDTEEEQQLKVEFAVEEVQNDDDIPPLLAFHDVGYLIFDPVMREAPHHTTPHHNHFMALFPGPPG